MHPQFDFQQKKLSSSKNKNKHLQIWEKNIKNCTRQLPPKHWTKNAPKNYQKNLQRLHPFFFVQIPVLPRWALKQSSSYMEVVVSQVKMAQKIDFVAEVSLSPWFFGAHLKPARGIPWNQAVSPPQLIRKGTDKGDLYWGHLPPGFFRPCGVRKCSEKKTSFWQDFPNQISRFGDLRCHVGLCICEFWWFFFDCKFWPVFGMCHYSQSFLSLGIASSWNWVQYRFYTALALMVLCGPAPLLAPLSL